MRAGLSENPIMWTRWTPWRQGQVLGRNAQAHFGLVNSRDPDASCVVVISHDCDLANDQLEVEPDVEVVVGRIVDKSDGNFAWGKAPRTLHLQVLRNGQPATIELAQTAKAKLPKRELAQFVSDPEFGIQPEALSTLRSWLAARYARSAFPDTLVNRFKHCKAEERFVKLLGPSGALISFVYFDLDQGNNVERPHGDDYELSIVLVFVPGDNPSKAAEAAEALAVRIETELDERLEAGGVSLTGCMAISEDDITVSQARVLSQWRLEHMTHRAADDQPGPPEL